MYQWTASVASVTVVASLSASAAIQHTRLRIHSHLSIVLINKLKCASTLLNQCSDESAQWKSGHCFDVVFKIALQTFT